MTARFRSHSSVSNISMATVGSNIPALLLLALLCCLSPTTSQGAPDDPANGDPGLSRHEELVLLSCLSVVVVMAVLIVLLLWYVVDRTHTRIRIVERHLPSIVEKMREGVRMVDEQPTATELEDVENQQVVAGTLAATEDFEGVHPLDIAGGRVRLTSYTRRNDIGIGTDFCLESQSAAAVVEPSNDELDRSEPNGLRANPTAASESVDFIFVDGEYVPKGPSSPATDESRPPPPYAYDNPAYDNPYNENGNGGTGGSGGGLGKKAKKDSRQQGKGKGKKKFKFSVYESHV